MTESFFWTSPKHAAQLLHASKYRNTLGLLIQINTARFIERYENDIELADFNTGYALRKPKERSRESFKNIFQYPDGTISSIKELTVLRSVPDLKAFIEGVH